MSSIPSLNYVLFLFLWMISPGPCFALIARNSVKYGTKAGMFTALGMALCDTIFTFFAIVGVAEFLNRFPRVLEAGKMIGAAYIFYIGVEIFLSTLKPQKEVEKIENKKHSKSSPFKLFLRGFLTDASNPLLIIGILAIILSFVNLKAGMGHIVSYAILIPITTIYVNFGLSICFGNKWIRGFILPYIKWFERFAGIVICGLAISILIS